MKKFLTIIATVFVISGLLAACGGSAETESFEMVDDQVNVQIDVSHKDDKVTKIKQVSTINYEAAGVDKDTVKEVMDEQTSDMEDVDSIDIDSDYGDEELVQTIVFNVEDTDLDELSEVLEVDASEEDLDYDNFTSGLEEQGFEKK